MGKQSRRKRNRPTPDNREVVVAIVPRTDGLEDIGVGIRRGRDGTVLAPDEARAFAEELEAGGDDPAVIAGLREYADRIPEFVAVANGEFGFAQCRIIGPMQTGPHALRAWAIRHRRLFQAAYRKAIRRGLSRDDLIIWGMPATESMDDPPRALDLIDRRDWAPPDDAGPVVGPILEQARRERPRPGYFDVIVSRVAGRFQGTCHAMMPMPRDDEALPVAPFTPGDEANN
jgi:hypothetical protein